MVNPDDSFNVNLAIFLSHLRSYSQRKDVYIDRQTVDMLSEAVYTIDRIVSQTKPNPATSNDNFEFIFKLEPQFYKIRPYISCRLCSELILASKDDFEAHVQKNVHQKHVQDEKAMAAISKLFPTNAGIKQNNTEKAVNPFRRMASVDNNDLSSEISSSWSIPSNSTSSVSVGTPTFSLADTSTISAVTTNTPTSTLARAPSLSTLTRISSPSILAPTTVVPPAPLTNPFNSKLAKPLSLSPTIISPRNVSNWRNQTLAEPTQYNGKYVVYVAKIHWITTKQELLLLFSGINILNGTKGIHFVVLNEPCVANNAFIEVATETDYYRMLEFTPKTVSGNYQIGRFVTVAPANLDDYLEVIEADDYPNNQSVLMMTNLPRLDNKDIFRFFNGLAIKQICWHNQNAPDAKAFVIFNSVDAIERAMKTSSHNYSNIRMYRSSVQQLEYYRNKDSAKLQRSSSQLSLPGTGNRPNASFSGMKKYSSQMSLNNKSFELSNNGANQQCQINDNRQRRLSQSSASYNILSLANLHQMIDDKSNENRNMNIDENANINENVNRVKARGFHWHVNKADVIAFFKGIDILNGEQGIRILKNVAMEAYVDFATDKDHDNALSRNGRIFQSHKIIVTSCLRYPKKVLQVKRNLGNKI